MNTKSLKLLLQVSFLLLTIISCKKTNTDTTNTDNTTPPTPDVPTANVYLAGRVYSNNIAQAAYWKNGVATVLTNGTKDANAASIVIQGNDIYTAGYITESNGKTSAVYWKNSTMYNLPGGTGNDSNTSGIVIQGTDVYISGWSGQLPVYWKNGVLINLPTTVSTTNTAGIAVQGSDVYVSGWQVGYTGVAAFYWKNGAIINLPNGGYAGNIVLQGTDVYISCSYLGPSISKNSPSYWKNGTPVSLTDGVTGVNAYKIAADGNDVTVLGVSNPPNNQSGPVVSYWKNGIINNLSDASGYTSAMATLNGDVYIAGYSTSKQSLTIWKNKTPTYIKLPAAYTYAEFGAMALTPL